MMATTPTQIAVGLVAARIQAFQHDQQHPRPTPTVSISHPSPKEFNKLPRVQFGRRRAFSSFTSSVGKEQKSPNDPSISVDRPRAQTSQPETQEERVVNGSVFILKPLPPPGDHHMSPSTQEETASQVARPEVVSIMDNLDGASDLARGRSYLRSVTEVGNIPHRPKNGDGEGMLDELDSLLEDAINKHDDSDSDSGDGDYHQSREPISASPCLTRVPHGQSDSASKNLQDPFNQRSKGVMLKTEVPAAELRDDCVRDRQQSTELSRSEEDDHIAAVELDQLSDVDPMELRSIRQNSQLISNGNRTVIDTQPVPRLTKQTPVNETELSRAAHRPSMFLRYRSSPVKQRAAQFEIFKSPARPSVPCTAPHMSDVRHKPFNLQQSDQVFMKPIHPVRQPLQHQILSSDTEDDIHPNAVRLLRSASGSKMLHSSTAYVSSNQRDRLSTSRPSLAINRTEYNEAVPRPVSSQDNTIIPPPASHEVLLDTDSVDDLSGDTATSQNEPSPNHDDKRPSIVKSKIQQLMTASKPTNAASRTEIQHSEHNAKAKECSPRKGDRQVSIVPARNVPPLQSSLVGEANLITKQQVQNIEIPRRTRSRRETTTGVPITSDHGSNPLKVDPATPLRGRSKSVRQHDSSRASPYSIEQRFTLSPNRSRSRSNRGAVRVSVELRDSPDRSSKAKDDRLLIVRATVEPEDAGDDQ